MNMVQHQQQMDVQKKTSKKTASKGRKKTTSQ